MSIEIMDYGFGVTETRERFYTEQYVNELTQRIAELEEQLANSIRPKFKIGQEVFVFDWTGQLRIGRVFEIQTNKVKFDQMPLITYLVDFYGSYCDDDLENDYFEEKDVFATYEEAQAKLEELRGNDVKN